MSCNGWPLDREGFVQHYLFSGPKVEPFFQERQDPNLLRGEASLREKIARHEPSRIRGPFSRISPPGWAFPGASGAAGTASF